MKYIKQFLIIVAISFIGELCSYLIPLPVAASVYGIVIMFICLMTGIIKVEDVRETAVLLIDIMPIMFVPAAVGLMDTWGLVRSTWYMYFIIAIVSTVVVMGVTGVVTQLIIHRTNRTKGIADEDPESPTFVNIEPEFSGMSREVDA